jgi:hypothetical protein
VERFARLFDWRPDVGARKRESYEEWQAELEGLRAAAIRETLQMDGIAGIARLAVHAPVPGILGWSVAMSDADAHRDSFLEWLSASDKRQDAAAAWVKQRAWAEGTGWVAGALQDAPNDEARLIVARQARTEPALWELLEGSWPDIAEPYWQSIDPWGVAPGDVDAVARQLLSRGRPLVAIDVIATALHGDDQAEATVDADLVVAVLTAALTTTEESPPRGDMLGYEIGKLLDHLDRRGESDDVLAGFEFAFFRALEHHRQPRALYAALGNRPDLFVQLVSQLYRPKDAPRRAPDRNAEAAAEQAWHVLHEWRTIPGLRDDGTVDGEHLQRWVDDARLALRDADRADVGDQQIGQMLAGSPPGVDGAWPAESVRDLIERLGSRELENGLHIGKLNLRGVTSRSIYEGGVQERALAAQFESWSAIAAGRWPRTSRLLKELAQSYERDAIREDMEAQEDADAG